ncbi:long-chain fatty acid transport protein 4 [Chrysoperla carnea]|uniref:long-chain fatty acid transport protein 4 n=1 Tax=Chrysoperla carnea TaxID=189513 RepID=UPI001D073C8A|nr:long-chain fatty acid transport protein 4 [Chrysoperla carnea]
MTSKHNNEDSSVSLNVVSILGAFILTICTFYFWGFLMALLLFVPYELLIRNKEWFYIFYKTCPRDFKIIVRYLKFNISYFFWHRQTRTITNQFRKIASKYPNKPAFIIDDRQMTFNEVELFSNQVARYFQEQGFKKGDSVALFMENKPEYVCFWLGLSKIGVITALINSNLQKDTLLHSITCASCIAVIYGTELKAQFQEIQSQLKDDIKSYEFDDIVTVKTTFTKDLLATSSDSLDCLNICGPSDKLVFIYTSGTTGLPKPAVIRNSRYYFMAEAFRSLAALRTNDIIYDPLPLYHSAGGVLGAGQALCYGITVVTRKKFSASNFWKDCIKYNCTVSQYIGEICRYLLTQPERPEDKQHKIRLMYGNGLRPQIWEAFIKRFNVKIIEFYGATEGNSNIMNIDSKIGAVGFVPTILKIPYLKSLYPVNLLKCDEYTGEIIRDKNGFCIPCKVGEPGVFVGLINPKKPSSAFEGYANKQDSERKIIRDVRRKGDMYFNSGDILVSDKFGYYYFKDRTGDTFRWRGENVATSEVEAVISNVAGLSDCVVYGVEIPNVEGKAGMAAIVDTNKSIDLKVLYEGVKKHLPAYARPLFIRIMNEVPMTGTYKLKKRDLQIEGYDITKITDDNIYFLYNNEYTLLTKDLYDSILNGQARL